MNGYVPELAACALWGVVIGMLTYSTLSARYKLPRVTRALTLIVSILIGCISAVYVVSRMRWGTVEAYKVSVAAVGYELRLESSF
jgi:hypothetical protein